MSESLAARLVAALDLAVFESCGEGRFKRITTLPAWWAELNLLSTDDEQHYSLGDESPFLREFIDDAQRFWQGEPGGWLSSGIWQESLADGTPLFLEALATRLHGVRVLLFKRSDTSVDERISLIQKSRENKLAYGQEIAQRERLAAELRRAKQAAEELSRAKSDFLAKMSHELRTPMNAVLGMTQLLLESQPTVQQRGYLEAVRDSGRGLLNIINDILDFSKAESRAMELIVSEFNIRDLLDDTLKLLDALARGKGLELTCAVADDIPPVLLGDPLRLRQVVFNLIGNSIKFTEGGRVSLRVTPESESAESIELQFDVSDTGVGIPLEKRDVIFDAFGQAGGTRTRRHEGTGLGLSIARQLVELMGGRIWLAATSTAGSSFRFTAIFRLGVTAGAPSSAGPVEDAAPVAAAKSLQVLLAEDNPLNQKVAIKILAKRGHLLTAVDTGNKAVQEVQRKPYDAVLMDCHMPEMDGFEATAAIREHEQRAGGHIPIIALTADASEAGREKCLAAGMDGYVTKPLDADQVSRLMLELVAETNKTR